MKRWPVLGSAALMATAAALPAGRLLLAVSIPVVLLLVVLAATSVLLDLGRAVVAVAVTAWVVAIVLLVGADPYLVLASGVLLRLWAGLPELILLGRAGVVDAVSDTVGGGAAAALVLLVARDPQDLPPEGLLLAIGAGSVLLVVGTLRLRR